MSYCAQQKETKAQVTLLWRCSIEVVACSSSSEFLEFNVSNCKDGEGTYCIYSTLIFLASWRATAAKDSFERTMVDGHGVMGQKSTTFTSMVLCLQGLFGPLKHLTLYLLPQAAPLSHKPSLTATNRFPGFELLFQGKENKDAKKRK
ncbi:hypothetical protein SLA2020_437160 [Shorea laevis]